MNTVQIPHPPIVTREEWLAQRKSLLLKEKELTKQYDRVAAERRRLPMVKIDKHYTFEGETGQASLPDLFDGQTQLVVYHFMFDPAWEDGCPGCTGFINAIGDISILKKRRTNFVAIARAPYAKLHAYKAKKGWQVPFYSSFGSDFNYDFHVTHDESKVPIEYNYKDRAELEAERGQPITNWGESHAVSVFFRMDDEVFHTYSTFARGVEILTDASMMLDVTPYGRQEDFEDSPAGWPQQPTYG